MEGDHLLPRIEEQSAEKLLVQSHDLGRIGDELAWIANHDYQLSESEERRVVGRVRKRVNVDEDVTVTGEIEVVARFKSQERRNELEVLRSQTVGAN